MLSNVEWQTLVLTIGGWVAGALTVLVGSHYASRREAQREKKRNVDAAVTDLLNGVTSMTLGIALEHRHDRKLLEDVFKSVDRLTVLDPEVGAAAVDFRNHTFDFLLVGPEEFEDMTEEERTARLSTYHQARQQFLDQIHPRLDQSIR